MSVFSISYMLRGFFNLYGNPEINDLNMLIIGVMGGLIWDFFPVTMMMVFHYRNFSPKE